MGIILSFITAILASLHDLSIDRSSKKSDAYVIALAVNLFSLPIIVPVFFWTGIPEVTLNFWIAVALKFPLDCLALVFRAKAHKNGEMALIVPMLCFTPVFVLFLAPKLLNQSIGASSIMGVFMIVIGAYLMKIGENKKGFMEPFKALTREVGVRYMLLVAFIWGFTSVIDGYGVINAGAIKTNVFLSFKAGVYWLIWTQSLSSILFMAIVAKRWRVAPEKLAIKELVPIGISNGFQVLTQMCAMGLIPAAYVISIKRLSVIFSILIGHFHLKNKNVKEIMFGAIVMIFGFILITLSK